MTKQNDNILRAIAHLRPQAIYDGRVIYWADETRSYWSAEIYPEIPDSSRWAQIDDLGALGEALTAERDHKVAS